MSSRLRINSSSIIKSDIYEGKNLSKLIHKNSEDFTSAKTDISPIRKAKFEFSSHDTLSLESDENSSLGIISELPLTTKLIL